MVTRECGGFVAGETVEWYRKLLGIHIVGEIRYFHTFHGDSYAHIRSGLDLHQQHEVDVRLLRKRNANERVIEKL